MTTENAKPSVGNKDKAKVNVDPKVFNATATKIFQMGEIEELVNSENKEVSAAAKDICNRVHIAGEASKPWIRRHVNVGLNSTIGTIVEMGALALGAGAGSYLLYDKFQERKAKKAEDAAAITDSVLE